MESLEGSSFQTRRKIFKSETGGNISRIEGWKFVRVRAERLYYPPFDESFERLYLSL